MEKITEPVLSDSSSILYPPGFSPSSSINTPPPLLEEGELPPEFKPGLSAGEPAVDGNKVFSLFIDNIPAGKDSKWLFNLFKCFGRIADSYIPGHKSRVSNSFYGFVRFVSLEAALLAISQMNGSWVGSHQLSVQEAIFKKTYGKARWGPHSGERPRILPRQQQVAFLGSSAVGDSCEAGRVGVKSFSFKSRSYAQVVVGAAPAISSDVAPVKKLSAFEDPLSSAWLSRCAVAKLSWAADLNSSLPHLSSKFLGLKKFMKWGGRKILLEFDSSKELEVVVAGNDWKDVFEECVPWKGEMVNRERLAWIGISHLPITIWNWKTFADIAGMWGSLVAVKRETINKLDLSSARLLIETEACEVAGSFEISVGGAPFVVDAREVTAFNGVGDEWNRESCPFLGPEALLQENQNGNFDDYPFENHEEVKSLQVFAMGGADVINRVSGSEAILGEEGSLSFPKAVQEINAEKVALTDGSICISTAVKEVNANKVPLPGKSNYSSPTSPPIGYDGTTTFDNPGANEVLDVERSLATFSSMEGTVVKQAFNLLGGGEIEESILGPTAVNLGSEVRQLVMESTAPLMNVACNVDDYFLPKAEVAKETSDDIFGREELIKKSVAKLDEPCGNDAPLVEGVSSKPNPKAIAARVSQNAVKKGSKGISSLSYGGSIKAGFFKKSLNLSSKNSKSEKKSEKTKQSMVPEYRAPSISEEIACTRDMSRALGISFDGVTDEQIHDMIMQEKALG